MEDNDYFFLDCAMVAYSHAITEGKQDDQEYVRQIAYTLYEQNKLRGQPRGDEEDA